ncbi:MAG: T9SS type A sorting domain-containing protein [Bacteroidia bacterium]|nr:T9SS type A sorting domain-containing protein [Bacteroidia bacterium]MBP9724311.1 T9SS type A sorting domain-containing protein [Bacteroidia bacterium]
MHYDTNFIHLFFNSSAPVKIKLLVLLLLLAPLHLCAQTLTWANGFGSNGIDAPYSIVSDQSGNVYAVGTFENSVDFDPGLAAHILTSNGNSDIYVAAYNSSGALLWAFNIGGSDFDEVADIHLDKNNRLLITGGITSSNVDFDPHPANNNIFSSAGSKDAFLAKYDVNGNHLWAFTLGGTQAERGISITTNSQNDILIIGIYNSGTLDIDPDTSTFNLTHAGNNDMLLAKYDSNGTFKMGFSVSGTHTEFPQAIITDGNGNIIVTGAFGGTNVDFDPDTGTYYLSSASGNNTSLDYFLVKYSSTGALMWAFTAGNASGISDVGRALAIENNNIYVTGNFFSTVDFSHGSGTSVLTSNGGMDIFVAKYNSSGVCQWAFNVGGTSSTLGVSEIGYDIAIRQNCVYVIGGFHSNASTVDFAPGSGTFNLASIDIDAFVAKYTLNSNFIWAFVMGGTGIDFCRAMSFDSTGSLAITGDYRASNFNADPNGTTYLTNSGNADFFITKFDATPLPVEWLYVQAERLSDKNVWVEWGCASETDNDYFTVERSVDLVHWEEADRVTGKGTILTPTKYHLVDDNDFNGISYYRIKQTDFNGKFNYSNVVSVNNTGENVFTLYPNPAQSNILLAMDKENMGGTLYIKDLTGKRLITATHYFGTTVNIELLPAGTYLAEYLNNNFTAVKKLVVQ